jgi:elongation factor P
MRKGMVVVEDGQLLAVHGTPWPTKLRLKNLQTGAVSVRDVHEDGTATPARLDQREMQYIYQDGDGFVFMDTETFEQMTLGRDCVGYLMPYIKEAQRVPVVFHEGRPRSIELPATVELAVVETEPAGARQRAVLETGLRLDVPRWISAGETVVIDTRSDEYVGRGEPVAFSPGS